MFNRAKETYQSRVKEVTRWDDVVPNLDNKNIVVIPWCDVEACEDDIKERSGRAYVFFFDLNDFMTMKLIWRGVFFLCMIQC